MVSALLLDNEIEDSGLRALLESLSVDDTISEIAIVSQRDLSSLCLNARLFNSGSLVEAFFQALRSCENDRVVVLSSALTLDKNDMAALVSQTQKLPASNHMYIPFTTQGDMAEAPIFSPETLIETIRRGAQWQLLGIASTKSQLLSESLLNAISINELFVRAFIMAYGAGDAVDASDQIGTVASERIANALCELSDPEIGRILKTSLEVFNIEEIFPALAWRDFSSESAAAAYHSLAALFIRVGDLESANQCLSLSEQLEESPRYFALKGLIAKERGETLGAVANMVSSLQCYEARKKNSDKHYLSFEPSDLEDINSQLVEGLNALNRRDNETALTHFSRAVFQFDPFYIELGVRSNRRS